MRRKYRKIIWILLFVLLCSNITGCSWEELERFLLEEQAGERAQDSGQVADEPNRRRAEVPQAQQKEVKNVQHISGGKYAYEQLDEVEKAVYDEMLSVILRHEEKISLSTIDMHVMNHAYTALCSDYGGLFWVNGYVYTRYTKGGELVSLDFSPKYTVSKEERQRLQGEIDRVVEEWFAGISINDGDYEKAKYVYELLALNTDYVENAKNSQNIISVFLQRQTVCQGYACAVQYLLEQLGVQSVIVSGTALGEPHAWNLICLDGEYYYMDATWGNNGYRNREGVETSFIDYNYMAMTTAEMQMGHEPNMEIELPNCTAVLNNYYIKEGNYIEEWRPEQIGIMLAKAWEERRVLTLRFSDDSLKEQVFQYFIRDGHIADYCEGISQINYLEDSVWKEISFCFNQIE